MPSINYTVTARYRLIGNVHLGAEFVRKNSLTPPTRMKVKVVYFLNNDEHSEILENLLLSPNNSIGGLGRPFYKKFAINDNDTFSIEYDSNEKIIVFSLKNVQQPTELEKVVTEQDGTLVKVSIPTTERDFVFDKKNLRHIQIEPFRRDNSRYWEPRNETDLYAVFNSLSEQLELEYCCGLNTELLKRLEFVPVGQKPDAILVDRKTGQYYVAEFKLLASGFINHQKREDCDYLICWEDDVQGDQRDLLPPEVIALKQLLSDDDQEAV
ncbi:MAG: hypothetical protein OEM52_10370 [bacterium]|nr:hypothetical protein [bacterium]